MVSNPKRTILKANGYALALCYMFATGIIHYLREMSARFYFGTSYGSGFYMAAAGWILDWFAVVALCMYGIFRSQQNLYVIIN